MSALWKVSVAGAVAAVLAAYLVANAFGGSARPDVGDPVVIDSSPNERSTPASTSARDGRGSSQDNGDGRKKPEGSRLGEDVREGGKPSSRDDRDGRDDDHADDPDEVFPEVEDLDDDGGDDDERGDD